MSSLEDAVSSFFLRHKNRIRPGSSLLVACSGGSDSVALAWVLKNLETKLKVSFHLAHVNHSLRGRDSDKDAEFVESLAQKLGWPFHLLRQTVSKQTSGNLEEKAREKRYLSLGRTAKKFRCAMVLTAHSADDQAETILMNILRGTGPDGLSGMPELRPLQGGTSWLGRPILRVTRRDISAYLRHHKIASRSDRTNFDVSFLRNWLRRDILPKLEKRMPGVKTRLGRLADLFHTESVYWEDLLDTLEARLLSAYRGGRLLDFKRLLRYPAAIQRRFLRRATGRHLLSFEAVENLRGWMAGPAGNGRTWQLRKGWVVERLSKSSGLPSSMLFWLKQALPPTKNKSQREEKN